MISHYGYVREKYGDDAKLLFSDTDSLTYEIRTEDLYEDFWGDNEQFNFSDYPREGGMSKFHNNEQNKSLVSLKMKLVVR